MPHAKPEFAVAITLIGIFLAIGIPSIQNGPTIIGVLFTSFAVIISGWSILALIRSRG
jgi:hypothetical protein